MNAIDVMITSCFHSSLDVSELAKAAKKKLQSVSKTPFLDVAKSALHLSGSLSTSISWPICCRNSLKHTNILWAFTVHWNPHLQWHLVPRSHSASASPQTQKLFLWSDGRVKKKKIHWPGKEECGTEWLSLYLEMGWSHMSAPCAGWEKSISMDCRGWRKEQSCALTFSLLFSFQTDIILFYP